MIDKTEQALWFAAYFSEAMKLVPRSSANLSRVEAWSHSMALIAEQFFDNDEPEEAESVA